MFSLDITEMADVHHICALLPQNYSSYETIRPMTRACYQHTNKEAYVPNYTTKVF